MDMETQFWSIVESYTNTRWWFGGPTLMVATVAVIVLLLAVSRLYKRSIIGLVVPILTLSGAVTLLLPSVFLAWQPFPALGIDPENLHLIPTATFVAVAQTLDQAFMMGIVGTGMLLLGAQTALGRGDRVHQPATPLGEDESPLMRVGDQSASGLPVTQFGAHPQTELLDGLSTETAWIEIVQAPSGIGERFAISGRLTIGRDPGQCELVLDDDTISTRHAYIEREYDDLVIYDWGSRNGTRVNGERTTHQILRDNDFIQLGRVHLRFIAPATTTDNMPTLFIDTGGPKARLVLLDEANQEQQVYPLSQLHTRIGRARHNEIVLDTPTVSRHHASVQYDGMNYTLTDANAANGTWLDDTRVLESMPLSHGQVIRLGGQQLRFEFEEDADVATT